MNYASKIITYLAAEDRVTRVILVAGAPPIEKRGHELRVVIEAILNPDDVRDTLSSLASHVNHSGTATLGDHGVFSFGIPTLGRFRVHHLTQRGSDMVCIQRMPFAIPDLAGSLADPTQIGEIDRVVGTCEPGIILVTGPSSTALARFVYGALARVNAQSNRVLYIAEQNLSFILKHQKSIVVQVEVGTDCPTLAQALSSALRLAPDLLYVRDLHLPIDYSAVMRAVDAGTRVLVSEAALSPRDLLAEWHRRIPADYDSVNSLVRTILSVTDDNAGRLKIQHTNRDEPAAAPPPAGISP
jgi:twitching motility protein PilT